MQVPKKFREQLVASGVTTGRSRPHDSVVATDGTRKLLRQLADGRVVEAVGIPSDDYGKARLTACVSSQVRHRHHHSPSEAPSDGGKGTQPPSLFLMNLASVSQRLERATFLDI